MLVSARGLSAAFSLSITRSISDACAAMFSRASSALAVASADSSSAPMPISPFNVPEGMRQRFGTPPFASSICGNTRSIASRRRSAVRRLSGAPPFA